MSYWGCKPIDCDYAFDTVGSYVYAIKERMLRDAENVIAKAYPEQGIVSSIQCIRLLDAAFPRCVRVHFRQKDLQVAQDLFARWYEAVKDSLPPEHSDAIRAEAEDEFRALRAQLLPA